MEYRIDVDTSNRIRKRSIRFLVPLIIFGGILESLVFLDFQLHGYYLFIAPAFVFVGFFTFVPLMYRVYSIRTIRLYASFILEFTDHSIIRQQMNTPDVVIEKESISAIYQHNGGINIKGIKNGDLISIPKEIEGYTEILGQLKEIKEITEIKTLSRLSAYLLYGGVIFLFFLFLYFIMHPLNTILLDISSAGMAAIAIYIGWQIKRSKNIDRTTRTSFYILVVIIFLISILGIRKVLSLETQKNLNAAVQATA